MRHRLQVIGCHVSGQCVCIWPLGCNDSLVGSSVYIEIAQSCPKSWGICRIYPSYFRTDVYLLYNIHQQPPKALNERSHLSCWPTAQWLVADFARWFTAKNAVSGCVGCIRFTRAWGKDVQRLFCSLNGAVWQSGGSEVKRIIDIYTYIKYLFIYTDNPAIAAESMVVLVHRKP